MKNARIIRLGMIAALCIIIAACASAPVSFKSITDQKYDETKGRVISGRACGFQLLIFIPIMTNQRAENAYMDLMNHAGGDLVMDIKVRESWYYALVGTVYCTEMQAMAYPKVATTAAAPAHQ